MLEVVVDVAQAIFNEISSRAKNTSGLQPIEFKVLIKPDDMSDTDPVLRRAKESGLAILSDERDAAQQVKGTLVACGGVAFHDFGDPRPKPGDRVYFAKYSGLVINGDDGIEYRLMNDKDVAAIVVEKSDPEEAQEPNPEQV